MPNKGNPQNLLRGPKSPDHAKRLSAAGTKALADQSAELDRAEELAKIDPERELVESYASLQRALRPLIKELERHPKDPSRNLIDAIRELRQSGAQALAIIQARGASTGPREILADLEDRLRAANLGAGPAPVVEHPSRPG